MAEDAASRGPNFTPVEDLCCAKAFIRASDDPVHGSNQKNQQFKGRMHEEYTKLIKICHERTGISYHARSEKSVFNRFKKLSRLALKLIGCESVAGDPPSGDTDKEEWEKEVRKLFLTRNPDAKNVIENVHTAKEFLGDFPKWRAHEEEDTEAAGKKRKERPIGNKKAKELKADKQFVLNCLNGSTGTEEEQQNERSVEEKKAVFLDSVVAMAKSHSAMEKDRNDISSLPHLSPSTRSKFAKAIFERRMKEMSYPAGNVLDLSSESGVSGMTEDQQQDQQQQSNEEV